ncbi:ester cyclase [Nonomuraea monospora]
MQTSNNKAAFRRFHAAISSGDADVIAKAIDELVQPDVRFHAPAPAAPGGVEAFTRVWDTLLRAFPDLHVQIEDVIEEGDLVACRNTVTGTHRGEYRGLAPTGRTVTYGEMFVVRFSDGRIAEIWGVVDVFSQLRQLGALPA